MSSGSEPTPRGPRSRPPRFDHRSHSHDSAHAESALPEPQQNFDHALTSKLPPQLVISQPDLDEVIQHLREAKSFAYDSEFIGELSYDPKLCLVQAATTTRVALIDPLAELDLQGFWELVADPSVEKIVHAGEQDVEPVFRYINRPPANLFDTQIAGGFVGLGYPLALSKLIFAMLGVKLSKGLTFSHWDRRPLTNHQLRYAADDVRFLPALRHEMGQRLDELGHSAWALEESAGLADPSLYVFDPDSQYTKIRGSGNLPPRNLAILREVTIWRDQAARHDDVPPRAFLRDEILLDLARTPVKSVSELSRVRGLPRPVEHDHGQALVAAIARAQALPADKLPEIRNHEPSPREKFHADSLCFAAQSLCAGRQIDPNLVISRQEMGEFYRKISTGKDAADMRILRGWRRAAVGEPLLALMRGEINLSLLWNKGFLESDTKPIQ
jgi:ribonuclease D